MPQPAITPENILGISFLFKSGDTQRNIKRPCFVVDSTDGTGNAFTVALKDEEEFNFYFTMLKNAVAVRGQNFAYTDNYPDNLRWEGVNR